MLTISANHIDILWSPAREVGLDNEPVDALVAELDNNNASELLAHLNAVVYADGTWKVTHYDRGEKGLIVGGKERFIMVARRRAEVELMKIWEERGLLSPYKAMDVIAAHDLHSTGDLVGDH